VIVRLVLYIRQSHSIYRQEPCILIPPTRCNIYVHRT